MPGASMDAIALCASLFLAVSIVALWWPRQPRAWIYFFAASLAFAEAAGIVSVAGLFSFGITAACLYALNHIDKTDSPSWSLNQFMLVMAVSFIVVGIATGFLPGFEKPPLYEDLKSGTGAAPQSLFLNYGKAAAGVLILGSGAHLIRVSAEWRTLWRPTLVFAFIGIVVIGGLAVVTGYARIEPRWSGLFFVWAAANLLFTCVAEEAFFRAFLQRGLARWLSCFRYGALYALGIASALFGIAHGAGGITMAALATLAGLIYGRAYMSTGRIESAVLAHFIFNVFRFLFLTPAVSGA